MTTNQSNQNYSETSPTAIVTSYPRTFTDIPYEKEIYAWLSKNCTEQVTLHKELAPEIEARYKLINKLLEKTEIKQVLELAAGYTSRGLYYSKKGYNYIEMDLENVTNNKRNILNELNTEIPNNLRVLSGNVLEEKAFLKCEEYLNSTEPLAILNEGLLRYLTFEEKARVAKNIHKLLEKHGGVWITSDVTPKKFIASQNAALKDFNKNVSSITSRNNLNFRFNDINHVKEFFSDLGFEVAEVLKFSEVKNELYSINELHIFNDKIDQTLEDAIVVVMKLK